MKNDNHKTKLQNTEHGRYKKQHHHDATKHDNEQLWERASRFVQETSQVDRSSKFLPYQLESVGAIKRSKKTTVHSYSKPSTVSQVAKWLTDQTYE